MPNDITQLSLHTRTSAVCAEVLVSLESGAPSVHEAEGPHDLDTSIYIGLSG